MESTNNSSSKKWIFSIGGGIILLVCVVLVLCIGGLGASVYGIFSLIRSSEVYQSALQEAQTHPQVIEALGEPIEPGWWLTGSVNIEGSSGHADFALPISGPTDSGMLYVIANKEAGTWHFRTLEVDVGQGERINLLE